MTKHFAIAALAMGALLHADAAQACGTPSTDWYRNVSDVVFDGIARCDEEARTCQVRITRVSRNTQHLALEGRTIEVDYQNWLRDWYDANADSNSILLVCGMPLFEPDKSRFRARFYANLDPETSELIIRRADVRDEFLTEED